jgi:hypothetical protein
VLWFMQLLSKGKKLYFHFNTALTTVSVMKATHYLSLPPEQRTSFSMASLKTLYHILIQKVFDLFGIDPKQQINNPKYKELINFGVIQSIN